MRTFRNILESLEIFENIWKSIRIFKNIWECLRIFQKLLESFRQNLLDYFGIFWNSINLSEFIKPFAIHLKYLIFVKLCFIDPKLYPIYILKKNSEDKDVWNVLIFDLCCLEPKYLGSRWKWFQYFGLRCHFLTEYFMKNKDICQNIDQYVFWDWKSIIILMKTPQPEMPNNLNNNISHNINRRPIVLGTSRTHRD